MHDPSLVSLLFIANYQSLLRFLNSQLFNYSHFYSKAQCTIVIQKWMGELESIEINF